MEERRPYTVVETPEFLGLVEDVLGSVQLWDEIKWGRDWLLERDPERGDYLPHYNLWVLVLQTAPILLVYYEIDHDRRQVHPLDVAVMEL